MSHGIIYVIPALLGGNEITSLIPEGTLLHIRQLRYFIVEKEKSARQFLKLAGTPIPQSDLSLMEIDKHAVEINHSDFLKPALNGFDIGLLSEAGAPAVADPGTAFIYEAHQLGLKVVPLAGPSSLLLALMASGLNGQSFCFHGYLPIDNEERVKKIRQLEKDAQTKRQTQLFIETPYRNNQVLKDLIQHLSPQTRLCIASNITLDDEYIFTQPVARWKKQFPDLHKKPAVFLIL